MGTDNLPDVALGDNIRVLRGSRTLEDIAAPLGVTPQAVSNWETGKNPPGRENVRKLAELFGISIESLTARRLAPDTKAPEELRSPGPSATVSSDGVIDKTLSQTALKAAVSILRPDFSEADAQALAAIFLSLALNPPDPASRAPFEDQLRARFQGALEARSFEK